MIKPENASNESSHQTLGGSAQDGGLNAASSTDDQLYTDLFECLESLVKIYRSLLDVVRREKEILVASRLDELNENNKSKDAMLIRIRSLENQRTKAARDLAQAIGADTDQPRLLDLANYSASRWQDRLRNMHSLLELLVRRVSDVNKQNEELVQAALNNITGAMDAIRDGLKPKATYARQGQMAQAKTEGPALVSREA